jgi:hypothetical protein
LVGRHLGGGCSCRAGGGEGAGAHRPAAKGQLMRRVEPRDQRPHMLAPVNALVDRIARTARAEAEDRAGCPDVHWRLHLRGPPPRAKDGVAWVTVTTNCLLAMPRLMSSGAIAEQLAAPSAARCRTNRLLMAGCARYPHAVDRAGITPALPIARHAVVSSVPIPAIPLFTCFPSLPADILLTAPQRWPNCWQTGFACQSPKPSAAQYRCTA